MIEEFEDFTKELTPHEREVLLPIFVRCLEHHKGSDAAITNKQMCNAMLEAGYSELSGARVRKLINHIRKCNLVPKLIATCKGYYIAGSYEEWLRYLQGLRARRNSIDIVLQMMLHHEGMDEDDLNEEIYADETVY